MKGSFRAAGSVLGWTLNAQARITDAALAKLSDCSSTGAASEALRAPRPIGSSCPTGDSHNRHPSSWLTSACRSTPEG